ncbi:hypothetical protein GF391_01490 [Candidatus Uhrbacteria bacterium]|nr:hypothetical protein [Candidatus Uhrbacteria bacterium]
MTSIADQFKERIDKGDMPEPIPKWRVQAKHAVLWILFGSFVIIGTASSGVAVWFMTDPNSLLKEYNDGSFLSQILDALPLFWIIMSLTLAVGAVAIFVHAPRGYRYRTVVIGGTVLLAFIAFGGAISATGMSDKIESTASKMPGYDLIQRPRINHFIQLDKEKVIGRVEQMHEGQMLIKDPRGNIWRVDVHSCNPRDVQKAEQSKCVFVVGISSTTNNAFKAEVLRPCPRGIRIQQVRQFIQTRVKEPAR